MSWTNLGKIRNSYYTYFWGAWVKTTKFVSSLFLVCIVTIGLIIFVSLKFIFFFKTFHYNPKRLVAYVTLKVKTKRNNQINCNKEDCATDNDSTS